MICQCQDEDVGADAKLKLAMVKEKYSTPEKLRVSEDIYLHL